MSAPKDRPVVSDALHEHLDPAEVEHLLKLSELLEQTWEKLSAAQRKAYYFRANFEEDRAARLCERLTRWPTSPAQSNTVQTLEKQGHLLIRPRAQWSLFRFQSIVETALSEQYIEVMNHFLDNDQLSTEPLYGAPCPQRT